MSRDRGRTADDERRSRLVYQDRVYFIDNRVMITALDLLLSRGGHTVVAQVIETELAVRAVSDVPGVLLTTNIRLLIVLNTTDSQLKEIVERTHPFRVAASKIIIQHHQMGAPSSYGVQIRRQCRDPSFPPACRHFRDPSAMQ